MWSIAETVPPEWYGGDLGEMERLVESVLERRGRVRELVDGFRESDRKPFPNWLKSAGKIGWEQFPEAEWTQGIRGNRVM